MIGAVLGLALHGDAAFAWTRFEVHASVAVGCALLLGGYGYAVLGPGRRRIPGAARVGRARVGSFVAGVAALFLALNGPLHDLSDLYLFSAHMVQHMLLVLVVVPLLLVGCPAWALRPVVARPPVARWVRRATHPLVAYAVYNLVFLGWHWPGFYNAALEHHGLHVVQHLTFLAAAACLWWPVVNPVPELGRLPDGLPTMGYLFAAGIPATILSAFLTFSDRVWYAWYDRAPRVVGLTPLEDQRLGGLVMWIPGMLLFWIAITAVYLRWTREEYRGWRGSGARP